MANKQGEVRHTVAKNNHRVPVLSLLLNSFAIH